MKNKSLITLLVIISAIASSCTKDKSLLPVNTGGVIQKQVTTTYMYGTHRLVDYNGMTIFVLESEKINLNDYLNENVEVRGRAYYEMPGDGPDLIKVTKVKR
jgi:hypothetical protein